MDYKTSVYLALVLLHGLQVCSGSVISDTIAALERAIQSYINTTLVTAHEIAISVENGVMKGFEEAENRIRNMTEGALHLASAVRECSSRASKELTDIRNRSRIELQDCIHPSAERIRSVLDEFRDDLQEVNQAVNTSLFNLTSCRLNLACDIRTLMQAHAKSSQIKFKIAIHFLDLQRVILVAGRNYTECVQKVTFWTRKEIQVAAEEAMACVSASTSTEQTSGAGSSPSSTKET
ncbi:uncharacterized protein [Anabrus simplex]|uniref:uncharacterized protein n=1 Tax=Anabrus simplex TaxID=316456 RepID=UPI0035A3034F